MSSVTDNPNGALTTSLSLGDEGRVSGIGIEAEDIIRMTDIMVQDMTEKTSLTQQYLPPRVIIDSAYFTNDSSQRLNKNQIIDRLRVHLQRAAQQTILFVNRENDTMIDQERALKRSGKTDEGTLGLTDSKAGADYRLSGRITSLDAIDQFETKQRYTQILFELTDLENAVVVWSNLYELSKSTQNDVVYR